MKILALLVLLTAPAGATLTGCQDTSGPLVLAKPRQTATGTQPIGCINYSFDILSASVAFVGSSVTHPQIWVSTIAGRNGSGLYLSSYTLVGSSVYVMGHAQFGSSLTLTNGAGIGGAVTFNGSSVTVRGEVLSSTLTAHAAYILNAATFGSSVTLRDGEAIGGAGAFNSSWTAKGAFGVGGTLALTSGQAITGAARFTSSTTVAGAGARVGLGINEVVSGRVQQASDYLLLGSPTSGATGRGAIRFGNSGYDLPSNVNTDSDGDKLTIWNTATDKAAIGMDSRAAIWFQSNGQGDGRSGFVWYSGLGAAPDEKMRLDGYGYLGLGAAYPGSKFHVKAGSATIEGAGAGIRVYKTDAPDNLPVAHFIRRGLTSANYYDGVMMGQGLATDDLNLSVWGVAGDAMYVESIRYGVSGYPMKLNGSVGGNVLIPHASSKVGIGTASPGYQLEVEGTASSGGFDGGGIMITNTSPGGRSWLLAESGTAGLFQFKDSGITTPNSPLSFYGSDSKNGVGINWDATIPGAALDVKYKGTAYLVRWSSANGTALGVVDSNGSIGIGTASPLAKLSVAGDSSFSQPATFLSSVTVTGRVAVSSSTAQFKFASISLADDGTYAMETNFGSKGIVKIVGMTTNTGYCVFSISGAGNSVGELEDPFTACSDADTDGFIDMIADGDGTYTLKNRQGAAREFAVEYIGQ